MRLTLCYCTLAVLLAPSLAQAEDYSQLPFQKERKYYKLQGNVLQVSEKTWAPPEDSAIYTTTPAPVTVTPGFGLLRSEEAVFGGNGSVLSLSVTAQEEGKKKKDMHTRLRLFYYQKDRLIAVNNSIDGKQADSAAFRYRRNGLVEQYSLYEKGKLQYKVTYVYKSGKIFTARKNNGEHVPVSMIRYKYNEDHLVETQHFDEQFRQSEVRRYSLQHTRDGLLNDSYSVSSADGKMRSGMSMVKDSLGNVLEQSTINADREVTEYHRFQYDAHHFPVEEKIFAAPLEASVTNRYTYDAQGNWTRKEIFLDGILKEVVLRTIQYAG